MTGIYLGSTTARAGKSLIAFSLGVLLQKAGRSVGYMKPVGLTPRKRDYGIGDADAFVVQEILGQSVHPAPLSPVMLPDNLHSLAMLDRNDRATALQSITKAYEQISAGKDITLVSGTGPFPSTGSCRNAGGLAILRELGLKILLVERLNYPVNYDHLLLLKDLLKDELLGVVLNDVQEDEMRETAELLVPGLKAQGIDVLGVVGHERQLATIRILDLAHGLKGRIVTSSPRGSSLVQGFLIGTMQVDNFMMHLRGKPGSAVIVGGDRADLQLAALHADSPCIILTGNIPPSELIRKRAEAIGATLISVREDTYTVARSMARILRSKKMLDLGQIRLAVSLVEKSLNMEKLMQILATAKKSQSLYWPDF